MIFILSNFLSLLRLPLALFFLSEDLVVRSSAIFLAMITDYLDGYLARKYLSTSQLGAFLDPLTDKFFVCFVASILMLENQLALWQVLAFLSRDFAVLLFAVYLKLRGTWAGFQFRSIWSGKIMTTVQFFVLLALTLRYPVPHFIFWCFIVLGVIALLELYFIERDIAKKNYLR